MKFYFVRHGESEANLLREFSNSGFKHPLTEKGIEQAQSLAHSLSKLRVEQIYSSPIMRAVQTAQLLAKRIPAPIQTTEALREWSVGIYEGTTDPVGWELHSRVQDLWFQQKQFDSKMPGGESLNDIKNRFIPFIDQLILDGGNSDSNILLVAHGGLYMAMLPILLKNIDFSFALEHGFPYTGCVLAETRPGGLYCLSWGGIDLTA